MYIVPFSITLGSLLLTCRFSKMYLRTYVDQGHARTMDDLNTYLKNIGAIKFTFVRHPFERYPVYPFVSVFISFK